MPPPVVATLSCRAQVGLEAPLVHVEVAVTSGLPAFHLVGLPATVVRESRDRVQAALLSSGFEYPAGRIVVNLAPAEIPKEGGRFELPIALGILIASGQLRLTWHGRTPPCELYGELGLGGEIKSVRGILLAAAHASRDGHELIVPAANADEALIAATTPVRAASHLTEVCQHLSGETPLPLHAPTRPAQAAPHLGAEPDLIDVRGQFQAKRALLIAAAGSHSLLMIGPPGCGKSMLAQRLPGLLPPLAAGEALDCAAIASVSSPGFNMSGFARRPFRSPHHTASAVSLVGGGSHARPGEISLAHHGVLFLDELPEFDRQVLEALREPLEAGIVRVARAAAHADYPAEFQLIAAMNPCPCGHLGDPAGNCRCTPAQTQRYRARISGPLLDRLDMHVQVPRVEVGDFEDGVGRGDPSAALAARVATVRALQLVRQGRCNARLTDAQVDRYCNLQPRARTLLDRTMRQLRFSGRTRQRILKLARTIADLDSREAIADIDVGEAVMLRCLDRQRVTSSCR
ncbi:MAG TPA: YifB family Mg chelatase-like AAA ATPase [Steroidobacteraceae bacterium]|jgi:magnesium chelatase family protein|nr:YifB family Mg chelatase-like AAA ATPase [Steroidobacteraceae bacterium]